MPWRTDLLEPIPGSNPSGVDLRYDPLFSNIKEARREEIDVPQGDWQTSRKMADWVLVLRLAGDALATKSKDLQLAAWMTEGMLKREGLVGISGGLELVKGLIEKFWDTLYPKADPEDEDDEESSDTALRSGKISWIGTELAVPVKQVSLNRAGHDFFKYNESRKLGYEADTGGDYYKGLARTKAIEEGALPAEDFDKSFDETPKAFYKAAVKDLTRSIELIEELNRICDDKFANDLPSLGPLRKALEEIQPVVNILLKKKLEQDPDPVELEAVAEETGGQEAEAAGSAAAAGPARAMTPEPTSNDDAVMRVIASAKYMRKTQPSNPGAYLMLRGLRWGEVRAGGSSVNPKLLDAPSTQVRTQLKGLLLESKWALLLEACENAMAQPCGRGWIDLQRYAITACSRLGADYFHVEGALKDTLRSFVSDVPKILEMTMMDDTPTANTETQEWLQREVGVVTGATVHAERDDDSVSEDALQLARSGQTEAAVAIVNGQLMRERSLRGRFRRKTQLAAILMEASQPAVALPILMDLHTQIETYKLEEWEDNEVVAEPLTLYFKCLHKLDADPDTRMLLYPRICKLDPLRALSCPQSQ